VAGDLPPVAFIGVGTSTIERRSEQSIVGLALDAAVAAVTDAGLVRDQIDGYVGAPTATSAGAAGADGADEVSMRLLAERLGLRHLAWGVDLAWCFPTDMAVAAGHALRSGACDYVLGVRALYHLAGVPSGAMAGTMAYGESQWSAPYGYNTAGARFATRLRRYLDHSGADRSDLFELVSLAYRNAARNPVAVWRDRDDLSLDEYLAAPMVAEPLCRFDCDMPICGAAAFVMTRGELATGAPHRPAYLVGAAGWQQADRIFERSRRSRRDIGSCQLYDGFSFMVWEQLERLGWCAEGTAWKFVADGECELTGSLPVNTFGGSLGEGRMHGMGHLRESILQVSGRAGDRQVPDLENCLVQVGPLDYSSQVIVSVDPR
jgi:acetyl-CoA acetyltransferase